MEEKILEIALDDVKHTRYYALNKEVSVGCNDRFFEGVSEQESISGFFSPTITKDIIVKRQTPLSEAKQWAREHGYTHLETVRIGKRGKNKTYVL